MTRAEKAKQYFLEGYNCSQAVAMAFADLTDMSEAQIARLTSGFGGGMGRMREVCGSISGATFILSYLNGYADPKAFDEKKQLYSDIQEVCNKFKEENGSIVCRELLGLSDGASAPTPEKRTDSYYKKRPCAELVECSARILDDFLKNK